MRHGSRALSAAQALRAVFAAFALAPIIGNAQPSWKVTVTPSLDPLPIGFCAAVHLNIVDESGRDVPRNPQGNRVTIADFDMTVTTRDGRSVAGRRVDESHWSACACQGAEAGATATVTASYPAQSLDRRLRVPGATVQRTATFTLGAAKGTDNPAECAAPPANTLTRAAPIALEPAPRVAREAPSAAPAPVEGVPFVPPAQLAPPPVLPNPQNFTAGDRGLGRVDFAWQEVPNAVRYRLDGPGFPATGYFSPGASTTLPTAPAGAGPGTLRAVYAGDAVSTAPAATASTIVRFIPPHSQPWLTKNNGAGLISDVQTPEPVYRPDSGKFNPGQLRAGGYVPEAVAWLSQRKCKEIGAVCIDSPNLIRTLPPLFSEIGLKLWLETQQTLWNEQGQQDHEAVYGNAGDLGVGRRAFCEQRLRGPPTPGFYTWCYATAHGIPPGQAGFNNPQTITHPGEGTRSFPSNPDDFILSMVIAKDSSGTSFLVIGKPNNYPVLPRVRLDTEGLKVVPFVCISCHGGKYNPLTRKVDGASFLPIDPSLLAFASPADQAAQEEKIRKINFMIVNSDPQSAIAAYIRGLYGGAPAVPGTKANPDYVPAGWAPQSGFYRSVVKPYCAMCHLAAPSQWNFASWSNFEANAGVIHASVCGAHTMPHSELQFKSFWTKDTGPIYLPGLLAATVGRQSC